MLFPVTRYCLYKKSQESQNIHLAQSLSLTLISEAKPLPLFLPHLFVWAHFTLGTPSPQSPPHFCHPSSFPWKWVWPSQYTTTLRHAPEVACDHLSVITQVPKQQLARSFSEDSCWLSCISAPPFCRSVHLRTVARQQHGFSHLAFCLPWYRKLCDCNLSVVTEQMNRRMKVEAKALNTGDTC